VLLLCILQSKLIAEQSKLETVKMMGARSKINAISLNVLTFNEIALINK